MAYDFDGREYEKASTHQKEWGNSVIATLEFRGDERILDLGCGDGLLTSRLADHVPGGEVVGIDSSRGMIEAAREKKRPNIRFMLLDINDIEFDEEFDVVFSNATLHWIKDHRKLLRNVANALRPDGRVRFNFAAVGNCSHFIRVMREAMNREPFSDCFRGFSWPWFMPSLQAYQSLTAESPLREVRVWCENADRYFPDVETMVRWIDRPSLVPFIPLFKKDQREAFRSFVINRMIELTRQNNGTCFETFRRVNLVARK